MPYSSNAFGSGCTDRREHNRLHSEGRWKRTCLEVHAHAERGFKRLAEERRHLVLDVREVCGRDAVLLVGGVAEDAAPRELVQQPDELLALVCLQGRVREVRGEVDADVLVGRRLLVSDRREEGQYAVVEIDREGTGCDAVGSEVELRGGL